MSTIALRPFQWQRQQFTGAKFVRTLVAGTAWGAAFTAGMTGLTLWICGTVCLGDIVLTAAISIAAGILTIGPLATYGRR